MTISGILLSSTLNSFGDVKSRIARFVNEREWIKFHTPINLALALSGECGEVCEIFQWKGPLDNLQNLFDDKERVHIGEEIADVFIYSTRLSDVCSIDLSKSVRQYLQCKGNFLEFSENNIYRVPNTQIWEDMTFTELEMRLKGVSDFGHINSPRHIVLSLQSNAGKICQLFSSKPENESLNSLVSWPNNDITTLAFCLASLCVYLAKLSIFLDKNLGVCTSDKFAKNEAKYPANLVKGSSAKYTVYADKIKIQNTSIHRKMAAFLIGATVVAVAAGLLLRKR